MILAPSERLNPDDSGRALPTIVRVYQLNDIAALESASFEEVWQQPAETLGEALLGEEELTLYPGQAVRRPFTRKPDAAFIALVAIVRRPQGVSWRSVLELPAPTYTCSEEEELNPPQRDPRIVVALDGYGIEGSLEGFPAMRERETQQCNDIDCYEEPETPDVPTAPDTPSAPSAPDAPSAPSTPSAPSAPSTPTAPSVPKGDRR